LSNKTPDELKSEAFRLLKEIREEIQKRKKQLLLEEGLTELEAEAKLLYSRSIQRRVKKRVISAIEKMERFKLN
jgi:hypothetical protein